MESSKLEEIATAAAVSLGYHTLRSEQKNAIVTFLRGNDVFVALPTGYGKSFCYGCLPCAFDLLREMKRKSIVIVISPLVALMKDQTSAFQSRGLSSAFVNQESSHEMRLGILSGDYQLVFFSPESILSNRKWRDLLRQETYVSNLVALIVDEAHCVKKWGETFRREFSRIGELRSIVPSNVKMMALTATASRSLRRDVMKMLGMTNVSVVSVSPNKCNIKYVVKQFSTIEECFGCLADELLSKQDHMGKVLIFCRSINDCSNLYLYFKRKLGKSFTCPEGAPDISKYRRVEMFHSCTEQTIKEQIISSFTSSQPESCLKIVVATIAFGMGIDCPNIRTVIHYGPADCVESYIQETGRAGRDGLLSTAILLHHIGRRLTVDDCIKSYAENTTVCRRDFLFCDFDEYKHNDFGTKCSCCDICMLTCECETCACVYTNK